MLKNVLVIRIWELEFVCNLAFEIWCLRLIMSRIGKQPIDIPEGVEVKIDDQKITIKGPKGELSQEIHPQVLVTQKDKIIKIEVKDPEEKSQRALWGLFQRLISNMIEGVTKGYEKKLEIIGVGYKAALQDKNLILNVGYSHPVNFAIPQGIEVKVEKNIISVAGIDKQQVGQVAAQIRSIRKPEPYKGKGIKYVDEVVQRKAGKAAKAVGGE
jgi:large subunit ribosomal protein L6